MAAGSLASRLSLTLTPALDGYDALQHLPPSAHRVFDTRLIEAVRGGLWSAETLSRCIVEASPDCIEVLDPQGNLQFANPTALQQLRSRDTAENEGEPWSLSWPEEARSTVLVGLEAARQTGVARFSHWRPGIFGDARFWDVALSRMLDEDGEPVGLLAVSRDITALAQAEADHDLRSRELSHRLKNVFALVNGLVTLSARTMPTVQPYTRTPWDRSPLLNKLPSTHRYRALIFNIDGKIHDIKAISADSDEEASDSVRDMFDGRAVELWDCVRFIERFGPAETYTNPH